MSNDSRRIPTGRMRYRIQRHWFCADKLVLQIEVDIGVAMSLNCRIDEKRRLVWIDASPEHLINL